MDENRKQAYSFLLSAALIHLKWDLVGFYEGLEFHRPWRLLRQSHFLRRAAHRAVTFHNLAFYLTNNLLGFKEELFWKDVESFHGRFRYDFVNYREMFDRKLAGENISVIDCTGSTRRS